MFYPSTAGGHRSGPASDIDLNLVEFMRRMRRLNPYRPATDTGLLKIFALVAVVILIVISGAFDCRFQFIYVGFC